MTRPPTKLTLCLAALLPFSAALAADFAVRDISGEQYCLPDAFVAGLRETFPSIAQCSPYPAGTVALTITPEAGELPIRCYEVAGRSSCMYAADIYVAAHYQGQWLAKTSYAWTPVGLAQLQPIAHWTPWSGTQSMGYSIEAGVIDLDTSQYVPPPAGFEVYVGIAPPGGPNFAPRAVAQIYPVAKP